MNANPNPYAETFRGPSLVSFLLAMGTASTALLLCWLWLIGEIDLGAFGSVFLTSLVLATLALLAAARFYFNGARRIAVGLVLLVPFLIIPAMLLAMHGAGLFTVF